MKNIKAIKQFKDKENNLKLINLNDELEVSNNRAEELIDKGFAVDVTPEKPKKKKKSD